MKQAALRIAVASGKGGTGKTTVATNLAATLADTLAQVAYVDCDVEEPNGHIFLSPTFTQQRVVSVQVPEIDDDLCDNCGACWRACRYAAIVALPKKVLTFTKLCHGCGGCTLACHQGAIREVPRQIGVVESGCAGRIRFIRGTMDIGEAMAPPVIRATLDEAPKEGVVIIDAPPGTSCPVITTIRGADITLLVTEPTPFGLNDLRLAVDMVRELGCPFAVAINRAGSGDESVKAFCAAEQIPVLLELPNNREIAFAYSRGDLAVAALPGTRAHFDSLYSELVSLARSKQVEHAVRSPPPLKAIPRAASKAKPPSSRPTRAGAVSPSELVVISGKGGTGKTSVVASFAALAANSAFVDCDVDAADLHLVLAPQVEGRWPFSGGEVAKINSDACLGCGICEKHCRFDAISTAERNVRVVDPLSCEGCGVCADHCPESAVALQRVINGEWFSSSTRHGPMTHAELGIAQENSGKLVSLVRREAQLGAIADAQSSLICDGSPGIGCPVIASITGAKMALVVTEPSQSGLHDLRRVVALCRQLDVKVTACINKADINPDLVVEITSAAQHLGAPVLGKIRYDDAVTAAQVRGLSVVEHDNGPASRDMRSLWERVKDELVAAS